MIIFLDDWKNYPAAIIDTKTPNRSFVRLAALYREMGIVNNSFLLALINPELQGVDPFDEEKLTLEQKVMIAYECKINPWYFFREILKAPAQAGGNAVMFEANRGNMALFWSFFNHITFILIQIRQTGKSFSTDGLMTYLLNIRCSFTEINLLTKDDTLRAANIKRLKDIDSELPSYLRQRTKADINNTEELTVKALSNRYRGHLPQKSPKMAYNVGRGLTSPIFQIDEGPFQPNIAISLPSALAAGTAARERAAQNGEPYGTILTTTAGKKDDRDGKYVFNFVSEAAEWSERFFDCKDIKELELLIRKNSRTGKLRINATFNHKQLGKNDEWLKKAIEDSGAIGEDADRDFFNVWTSGTLSSPLPVGTLEKIRNSQRPENHTEISKIGGYLTRWFVSEEEKEGLLKSKQFVMALDTSDASGGDDISLQLHEISTFETIATGTFNETNLITFAEWICEWIVRYENITVIIERKSSGVAIIDYLLLMLPAKGIDPFKRLFNRIVNDYEDHRDRYQEVCIPMGRRPSDIYTRNKKAFGFATSGSGLTSRTELYSTTLQNAAKNVGDRVRDLTTINQITGLINLNGRIDHQAGEHDDMVIGWLLNFWLLSQAKNLSFYGIDTKQILSSLNVVKIKTAREYYDFIEQQNIRSEMDEIYSQLQREDNEYIIQNLEQRLRHLNNQLVLEDGEKFSIDELINALRDEKKRNRQQLVENNSYNSYYNNNEVYAMTYKDPRRF